MNQFQTLISALGAYVDDAMSDHPEGADDEMIADFIIDQLAENEAISDWSITWLNDGGRELVLEMIRTHKVVEDPRQS